LRLSWVLSLWHFPLRILCFACLILAPLGDIDPISRSPNFPHPANPFSHPTPKPLLMLCVSLPHAADVFQNGTRHVASGPKSHLCPAPFLQRLTISQLIANFFGKYHSSYLFGENRFNHSEIKVFQGSASLYH